MASSLAAQLAQGASLNAALLNTSRRRPTESYLFSAKEAQQHDLDAIFALGTNGFAQLKRWTPRLVSDTAKGTDRTLLPADANAELNKQITSFLPLLGQYLLEAPTGRVVEWLVRRFRINEFNVDDILALFLPYHESPHFEKIDTSTFRFLQAYKSTAKPLPRSGLVAEMLKNPDLARFIAIYSPANSETALMIFHTGVLLDFIARSQDLNEGTTAFLLAASLTYCKSSQTILNAIASCAERISAKQLVRTLACLCGPQDELEKLPRALVTAMLKKADIDTELRESLTYVGSEKLICPWIAALISKLEKERCYDALNLVSVEDPSMNGVVNARRALSIFQLHHPRIVESVCEEAMKEEDKREAVEQIVLSLAMITPGHAKAGKADADMVIASLSADANVRAVAVRELCDKLASESTASADRDAAKDVLRSRVLDTAPAPSRPAGRSLSYISSLSSALHAPRANHSRSLMRLHLASLPPTSIPLVPQIMLAERAVYDVIEGAEGENGLARYELLGGCVDALRWEHNRAAARLARRSMKTKATRARRSWRKRTLPSLQRWPSVTDNILASNNYSHLLGLLLGKLQDANAHARALAYLTARALLSRLSGEHQIDAAHAILRATGLETLEGMGEFMRGVNDLTACGDGGRPKAQQPTTLQRLQVSVLAMMPMIPRPVGLLRAVYILSNSSASLPVLSLHLLRVLFVNLGDESLGFLAGIWLSPLNRRRGAMSTTYAPPRFTMPPHVLPAVLVALQSPERRVREAAVTCIRNEPSAIYAYDAIYGPTSNLLQYAEWTDFGKYVAALGSVGEHMRHDPAYLREFHQEHLSVVKGEGKKVASYKHRIVFYLLSHVNACPMSNAKLSLLQSLETTASDSKCQALKPTLEHLSEAVSIATEGIDNDTEEFLILTTSSFDSSAVTELNDTSKSTWSIFEKCLRTCLLNRNLKAARVAIIRNVQQLVRKQLCQLLLDIAGQSGSAVSDCKLLLASILDDVPIITRLLVLLQPAVVDAAERAQKRARMDPPAARATDNKGQSLTLMAEVLGSKSLPGSSDLSCHDSSAVPADKTYLEQLLMTAWRGNVQAGSIRVDILIELIRAADNPQTFHQALLLIAAMALFTFMGRTFRVVQKTIDSIVPVMVASLRSSNDLRLDLYTASRDFLLIFTDASNHIPRHRRAKFYSHLVDILGPDEFLAPVCMLLVDKVSKRVVRQDIRDARTSLSLPIATFQNYSITRKMELLVEVAREAEHLLATTSATTSGKLQSSEGQTPSELLSMLLKVTMAGTLKIMAATDFLGGVVKILQSPDSQIQLGVLDLLKDRVRDIADQTRRGLTQIMQDVIEAIRDILSGRSGESLVVAALQSLGGILLNLLATLIPLVLARVRAKATTSAAFAVLLPMCSHLGPRIIPHLKRIVQECTQVLHPDAASSMYTTALDVLQSLLTAVPTFWGETEFYKLGKYAGFFILLKRSLRAAERPIVLEYLRTLFNTFQQHLIESAVVTSFLELVVKLNETAFRPLFRKLSDWAFTVQGFTFCHIYAALLDYFKVNLDGAYMSFIWSPFLKLLSDHSTSVTRHPDSWTATLIVISKTLAFDEGVAALVKQIPVCVQLRAPEGRTALLDCLVAAMEVVNDDALLKAMNIDILMHTRSEEASLRLFSLSCSTGLWKAHGGKLLGLVAETTTFITECAEDDNDSVVREAHNLKDAVEAVAGKVDV
ncbi:uncharacterized protein B0H18DRAFT_1086220 [Fomitopsis serialis]|uniref:uncharacterized protein n=1 Tax=Fomitopsis serialis TaxID=139415 RepID=UPI0020082667|nr:uncharacterized protein B0H18DRAFT_1086220 [Neoantrodia serialis]KAH9921142.1 hypothetical protein B0H18DRAFT_1086220 [Neoantrodia serialis]